MRTNFVKTLLDLARADKNIMLLTGDLGFMALEPFRDELPEQYLNAGVSEQNITGVAAGLALSGKQVFIYSIIPFVTMRNLEHIRNDIAAHNLDVKIVGVGAGYSYSIQGTTHQAKEDIGVLRSIPNLKIVAPGDPWEVREAVKALVKSPGPAYLRLGRNGEPELHKQNQVFELGKGIVVREGTDVTLIATSNMLESAMNVASELEKRGIKTRLISMHTIKPLDSALVLDSAQKTRAIFTIEEHYLNGGLGTAVAEVLAESKLNPVFRRFGLPDTFDKLSGSQKYLRRQAGISEEQILEQILKLIS
jgi:transketolase